MEMKRTRGRSSVEEALSSWYEALCRMEEEDLGLARNRNGREIPWRLRNAADYDVQADALRRAFVEDRLKKRAYRPYRMLLLAYPEEAGRSRFFRQGLGRRHRGNGVPDARQCLRGSDGTGARRFP